MPRMCGIAAIHHLDGAPADRALLDGPMSRLAHRGPDGSGIVAREATVLGHWRLSILDPTDAGAQPMERDGVWLIHNGEIYNYLELADELRSLGARFSTETDTEVVLAAYRHWGLDAFERFNGMWAMILWDPARRRLVASRDRLGVKPLYVRRSARSLVLASEVQAIARAESMGPGVRWRPEPNESSVRDFLERGLSDHADATFVAGIDPVPPGHLLVAEDGHVRSVRYWSIPALGDDATPASSSTAAEDQRLTEEFVSLFDDAVMLRLRSDVALGTCLSGGLDSSAIARTTALLRDRPETRPDAHQQIAHFAFHARFPADGVDESSYAELVAEQSGMELRYADVPDDLWERLIEVVRAQGEPFASTSVMAQHLVMERARSSGVKVLLDGQGADELLGGYDGYQGVRVASLLRGGHLAGAFGEVTRQARAASPGRVLPRTVRGVGGPRLRRALRGVFPGRWGIAVGSALRGVESLARAHDLPGTALARELWQDTASESLPALLRYEDRNSMAFGIEARVPFLDYRLVELAARLPDRLRVSGGRTKLILRRAMRERLPSAVVKRRDKMGFFVPQQRWLEAVAPRIASHLRDGQLVARGWVSAQEVERLLADRAASHDLLWRALNTELWIRELDGQAADELTG